MKIASKHVDRKPPRTRAAVLRDLARIKAEEADRLNELAQIEAIAAPSPDLLDSHNNLPRDVADLKDPTRAVRERCARGEVPGASKEGHIWYFTREAWLASRTQTARRVPAPVSTNDLEAEADAALAAIGLRVTRRAS